MSILPIQQPVPGADPQLVRRFLTWVRKRTCGLLYGTKSGDRVKPSITLADLQFRLNTTPTLKAIRNQDFEAHFGGEVTHYFYGCHRQTTPEILVKIDIDVMKAKNLGTTAGAWAFAKHLQQRWPGLYCEPSTGGKGVHCYPVLRKGEIGARQVRFLLRRLEQWLREEAARVNADIELVEVMGAPPLVARHKGLVAYIKAGDWAKIPRQVHRADEIMATTRLSLDELRDLRLGREPDAEDIEIRPAIETVALPGNKIGTIVRDVFGIADLRVEGVIRETSHAVQNDGSDSQHPPHPRTVPTPTRSVRNHLVFRDMGESKARTYGCGKRIDTKHIQIITQVIDRTGYCDKWKVGSRKVVAEDVGIILAILLHCSKKMNADGSLPGARVMAFWKALYKSGDVGRAPNAEIYTKVFHRLLAAGVIEARDMTYLPPTYEDDDGNKVWHKTGNKIPGQACKWKLSASLIADLEDLIESCPARPDLTTPHRGGALIHSVFSPRPLLTSYDRPTIRFIVWNRLIEDSGGVEDQLYSYAA